jgi:hypothetical protein
MMRWIAPRTERRYGVFHWFRALSAIPRGGILLEKLHSTEPSEDYSKSEKCGEAMMKFLLWCILLVLCWPLALAALVLYPLVWLVLLPFRMVGIAVGGALALVAAIIFLPLRLIRAI